MSNMTQTNSNSLGWFTSILLHIGVFFAVLNTPILKDTKHTSFLTVHLINEETSLTKLQKGAIPDETVANESLAKTPNNELVKHYPIQQLTQENLTFKQLDRKKLASIQEDLPDENSGKNQVKKVMSVLPKRKPKNLALVNKAKLERVNIKSNNTTLTMTQSEEISSNNPLDRKNRKEKTSVMPSGKKPDKKLIIKPLINLPTRGSFDAEANLGKTIKISSSTGIDDLVPDKENVGPVLQELSLPFEKKPNKVSPAGAQKSKLLNNQNPARPLFDRPQGEVAAAENYDTPVKKANTLTNDSINNFSKNEKSGTFPTRIMSPLSDEKIFNNKLKNHEKKLSSIKQNKNPTSDVKIGVNKNLLKTWGASVRNDVVKRTLGSKLSRDVKIVLKISKTGELLTLEIIGSLRIDKNIENFISTIKTPGNFPSAPVGLKLDYVNFPINFRSSG